MAPQPAFTWTVSGGGSISGLGLFFAGNVAGGPFTVTATSGAVSGTASVTVGDTAPTVATPAAANPNPANGFSSSLSVLGADDGGEASLTYTWASVGPAAPTFSANGTNAAKNTLAQFGKAGSYTFTVTIKDAGGKTVTSAVVVTVNQTVSQIDIAPLNASVVVGATKQFTATASDQFGNPLITQPAFTWTVTGGGSVSASGLFTAGTVVGGPFTITAKVGTQ